jgi:hypothetical protein
MGAIFMSDTPTLARFYQGWKHGGTAPDGMPLYYETIMIRLDRPPYLSVQREAEPSDYDDHAMAFELFQREQSARKVTLAEGYPLTLWPACTEPLFKMLADRDIHTVEQLAKIKKADMPAELRELAERAAKLVELQKGPGKYEELLRDRDGRIKALEESLEDAGKTIMAQKSLIETLKATKAAG